MREELMNNLANKLQINVSIIQAVVTHQFDGAYRALDNGSKSVELSGFGKFLFNDKKANKQMEKYESQMNYYNQLLSNPNISESEYRNTMLRITTTQANIKHLKPKI